jgi:hypothetical protein
MTVSVANNLYRASGLSEVGRLVVALIDGGQHWLDWAARDAQARYHFADEAALVSGIQTGLHGAPFILLPTLGLLVGPAKLMAMSVADLRTLSRAEATGEMSPTLQKVLQGHDLALQAELGAGLTLPAQLGIASAPLFATLGLDERIALLRLQRGLAAASAPAGIANEAAGFAIRHARTVLEFSDYFLAYLDYATVLGAGGETATQRGTAAQAAIDTLLPLSFGALDCPSTGGLAAPWEVDAAISEWQLMGRQIGFARASLVVQQVIANGGYAGQTGGAAAVVVRDYLAAAQALLSSSTLGRGRMAQDGASCAFRLSSEAGQADLDVGPTGLITLRRFRRAGPAAPRNPAAPS